jgi:hypothetical protein
MRDGGDGDSYIGCNNGNCQVFPTSQAFTDSEEAIAAWNTRHNGTPDQSPISHAASKSLVERFEGEKFADDSTDKRRMWNAAFSQAIGIAREFEAMGDGSATIAPVSDETVQPITAASASFFGITHIGDASARKDGAVGVSAATKSEISDTSPTNQVSEISVVGFGTEVHTDIGEKLAEFFEAIQADPDNEPNLIDLQDNIFKAIRPYLRTTEPVSLEDVLEKLPHSTAWRGHVNSREWCKAVLEAAEVPYAN